MGRRLYSNVLTFFLFEEKVLLGTYFFISGGITNTGEDKWPPLDDYQAPYREPILAPTTNSLTNGNGIISILPPPPKFSIPRSRLPRNYFLPSVLLNSEPKTVEKPPKPPLPRRVPMSLSTTTESGFVPVTPSWLSSSSTQVPKILQNPRYIQQ